jgi:hypothetical protein
MFGSTLQTEWITPIRKKYDHLTFWLDYDKRKETVKHKSRLSWMFKKVDAIITDDDPKEYTDEELLKWLR